MAVLKIAGSDAKQSIKDACDLVLNGITDVTDVNTFLLNYTSGNHIIIFYKTVYVSGYLTKKTNHNWIGKSATIKMMDGLSQSNYVAGIIAEGGNHNFTFIRDFELDGNEANNSTLVAGIYTSGVNHEDFNNKTSMPTDVSHAINLKLKNIHSHSWIRSCILPGTGWICKNLKIGKTRTDHNLYASGAANLLIDKVLTYGFTRGTLHISGANPNIGAPENPENIKITNIYFNEHTYSNEPSLIHIRSGFQVGEKYAAPCKNISVDNLVIRQNTAYRGFIIFVGAEGEIDGGCESVQLKNIDAVINSDFEIVKVDRSKNIKIQGTFDINGNNQVIPFAKIYGGFMNINNYDFSDCLIDVETYGIAGTKATVFGFYDNNEVKGFDISNSEITNADVLRQIYNTTKVSGYKSENLSYDKLLNVSDIVLEV